VVDGRLNVYTATCLRKRTNLAFNLYTFLSAIRSYIHTPYHYKDVHIRRRDSREFRRDRNAVRCEDSRASRGQSLQAALAESELNVRPTRSSLLVYHQASLSSLSMSHL
jgi:hypothetical protein